LIEQGQRRNLGTHGKERVMDCTVACRASLDND
jgi:hypothetical protein